MTLQKGIVCCLLSLSLPLWTSLVSLTTADDGEPVVIGKRFHIHSDAIGEDRSCLVHTPTMARLTQSH